MPKKPIAIDPEVINREGETQVVRDSGTNHSVLQRLSVGRGSLLPCSGYYPCIFRPIMNTNSDST